MTVPNVSVTVEPGDGSSVYYQPLAKETVLSASKYKIGLVLDVTNNETFDIEISNNTPFVKFPNIPQIIPIGGFLYIPSGKTRLLGMTGGAQNGFGAGQQIIRTLPPPSEISIILQFDGFDGIKISRTLQVYTSPTEYIGYKFPSKPEDLSDGEFWMYPGYHGFGDNQIFAHDLRVIAWNETLGKYDTIKVNTDGTMNDGTMNEHYLAWEMPIYSMANGEVISFDNDIDDYQFPGTGFPDPQFFKNKYCGNGFQIRHGTDIVSYCHMKKGSLNSDLMQSHAVVNEGDFLGVAGNSGNSTEPHLHIDAVNMTTYRLRPLLFRDIQVLSVDTLTADPSSSWVHVNGQGLPATMSAVWPSATPIPSYPIHANISRWKAVAEIIFGIIGDGGDLIITPKGRRLPPPPPDPLRISSIKRDMLLGLALTEFALIASSNKSVKTIQRAGIDVMQEAIVRMKKLFESKSKEN